MPNPVLLVREGARYTCFGDGLCCTSAHALGPVTDEEARRLRVLHDAPTVRHGSLDIDVVRTLGSRCLFLEASGECRVHREQGEEAKPATCREFPFGLAQTPSGLRVTTQHRCPCRTLGDRAVLTPDSVRSLSSATPDVDHEVTNAIEITPGSRVAFADYQALEASLLARLRSGEDALAVLGAESFPTIDALTWPDVGHLFRSSLDGTIGGDALATFGDEILRMHGYTASSMRPRSWTSAFDRAAVRVTAADVPELMLNDFVADNIWGLAWHEHPFATTRHELATRVAIARSLAARFGADGSAGARDMAEAIMVVELAGESSLWRRLMHQLIVS